MWILEVIRLSHSQARAHVWLGMGRARTGVPRLAFFVTLAFSLSALLLTASNLALIASTRVRRSEIPKDNNRQGAKFKVRLAWTCGTDYSLTTATSTA